MKISKKLRLLLFLAPVVIIITGGAAFYFGYLRPTQLNQSLQTKVLPAMEALEEGEQNTRLYAANVQHTLVKHLLALSGIEEPIEPPTQEVELQAFTEQLTEEYFNKDALSELKLLLADLKAEGNNFQNALRSAPTPGDAAEEAPQPMAAQLTDAIADYNNHFQQNFEDVTALLGKMQSDHSKTIIDYREAIAQSRMISAIASGAGLLLILALTLIYFGIIKQSIHQPLERLLARMKSRQKMVVEPNEVGEIAGYINRIHTELKETEKVIHQYAKGGYLDDFNDDGLPERIAAGFLEMRSRFKSLDNSVREKELELKKLQSAYAQKEKEAESLQSALEQERAQSRQQGVLAELDTEGKFIYANNDFLRMTGYGWRDLEGKKLNQLNSSADPADNLQMLATNVSKGRPWNGTLQLRSKDGSPLWVAAHLTPVQNGSSSNKLRLLTFDISKVQKRAVELERELANKVEQLQSQKKTLQTTLSEQAELKKSFEDQRSLEYRLVQQQAALQELTRNDALKNGNVREAMRSVAETAVYALDEERVGIWLFAVNGQKLRCVDLYERQNMSHTEGFELAAEEVENFFAQVKRNEVMKIANVAESEVTHELKPIYLEAFGVQALLSAPIRLGGNVIGFIMTEHTGEERHWTLDEQNFLMSIGDIISLALEQGNRRAMEEELRMTLEESQALEEELRQNAEEIEATNEEMRRTQVELRGQINALNNAAIVSETNLQGVITYANMEFARIYGFSPKKVMGQNHRILKSAAHNDQFYENMWRTIVSGNVWKGELRNQTANGNAVWVNLTITPVLGLDGKPYKFIGVAFDVTQQKKQEEQVKAALNVALQHEEQLRNSTTELEQANEEMRRTQIELAGQLSALNNSSLVYESDMEGQVIYANDELLAKTGYTRDELVGKHYSVLKVEGVDEQVLREQWKTIMNGEIWRGELEMSTKQGNRLWAVVTNTPVLDENGDPIKSINVLTDITGQKEQEFRLKKQQQSMVELTQHPAIKEGDTEEAYNLITKIGLESLNAARVAIWMNEDGEQKVRCVAVNQEGKHIHDEGTVIERSMYPNYFRSLDQDRIVASSNPQEDDRTKELAFTLLKPENVTAVLDVAIRFGAKTVGVLSIEHKDSYREWAVDEISFSTSLADAVGLVLEQKSKQQTDKLKQAFQQLEEANAEMLRQKQEIEEKTRWLKESIRYAKRIQNNILPDKGDLKRELGNYFIVFRPKDIVGGDFYWFSSIDDDRRVVIVADGTGHGVPGAFLTLIGYLLLNQIVNEKGVTSPEEILYYLHLGVRKALKQDEEDSTSRDGMDIAVSLVNMSTLEVAYAGANLPFYYYQDWEVHEVKPTKKSIGGEQLEEERIFDLHHFQLKPGDAIYMYTDGFVDQLGGPDEKRFGKRRFRDLILRTQHESMKTQRALLNLEWKDWKDDREQLDDVTVFGLKF